MSLDPWNDICPVSQIIYLQFTPLAWHSKSTYLDFIKKKFDMAINKPLLHA